MAKKGSTASGSKKDKAQNPSPDSKKEKAPKPSPVVDPVGAVDPPAAVVAEETAPATGSATVTVITDRIALLAIAKLAGWEPNDPDIPALSEEACKMELGENVGLVRPEDKATIEAYENGPSIWAYFTGVNKGLAEAAVAGDAKTKKAAEIQAAKDKKEAEKKAAKDKKAAEKAAKDAEKKAAAPAVIRYTRSDAFADALKKKPGKLSELIKDSDALYAGKGGSSNEKEAKWMAGYAVKLLTAMKLLVVDGDEIKTIADCITSA
jgi:hypothetical protein